MKIELPTYPSYRRTDAEWLGEIPTDWRVIRLARLNSKLTNGYVGPTRDILRSEGVRYLQSLHLAGGHITFDTPYFVSDDWSAAHQKSILETGDVLIAQTGADTGEVAAVTNEFAGSNCHALIIISTKRMMLNGFFLSAVLRSHYGYHSLKSVRTGALHPHLNCTKVRDIYVPVPPMGEQSAILTFLDRETAKIDLLMGVRRQQVRRLQEQHAAVIHSAVTNGLDPKVKFAPADLPWASRRPAHWARKRLKFVGKIVLGKMIAPRDAGGMRLCAYLKARNVRWLEVDVSDVRKMWFSFEEMKSLRLSRGDIVVTEGGEVGRAAIWNGEIDECYLQNSVHKITICEPNEPEFFLYQFHAAGHAGHFEAIVNRISIAHLTGDKLANISFLVPPREEQQAIVSHIKRATAKVCTLISEYERELELLAEYRASLISHAVTGKIDIRAFVSSGKAATP